MRQHFTEEEANAILRKAVERQPMGDEMSRDQLQAIASELGITPQALAEAETAWETEQHEQSLRAAFDAERRAAFWGRLPRFMGGNFVLLLFLGLAIAHGGHATGLLIALLIAFSLPAIKMLVRGMEAYHRGPGYETEFHNWLEGRATGAFGRETYAAPPRRRHWLP
jgi:hypothetical protein